MDSPWIIASPLRAVIGMIGGGEAEAAAEGRMQLSAFVRELERASALMADRAVMWRIGETLDMAHLGAIGGVMATAPALGVALRCFADYFGTVQSATTARLVVQGDAAQFHYRILDEDIWPRRADAELTMGLIAGTVARYAPQADRAITVQFEGAAAPSHEAIATRLGRPVRIGEDNVLTLPVRLLDAPRPETPAQGDTEAFRAQLLALGRHFRDLRLNQPASDRVLELLLARMGHAATDQDSIAREMGMSHRTLRRRLDDEGRTFLQLAELARRNIGHALLIRTELPLIEIAMRLGYSDHTAFSRAFSRWFGMSPRALRKAGSGVSVST